MFTGIVTAVGRIASARPHGDGLRLRIDAPGFGMDDVALGDSIALQGVCHTVVAKDAAGFDVDTSAATLAVTTGLAEGREVNLEKSLTLADRLGGHLVSGHVDGVGTVTAFEDLGGSWRLEIEMPAELARYVARKGSIAVDGVSLTVNSVAGRRFEVNIIPHTRAVTTMRRLAAGAAVNLEVDMTARYLERLVGERG
ncbi:MAG: riboflavin synthase [Betaproteobacteria bacterium]|nr:riboflavin synthase [Betaproteobacteria bacterium]PWB62413.1 MAG: riboflavin synthase [Betaproteobacteria bacterium]